MVTSIWAWSKLIHSGPGSCATKLHNWTETMSFSYPWNKPWMQMISFYLPTCFLFTNIVIIDFFGRGKRFEYINLSDALFIHHFNISRRARSCLMMTVWGSEAPYSPALAAMGLYIRYVLNVLTQVTTRQADSIAPGITIIYLTIGH